MSKQGFGPIAAIVVLTTASTVLGQADTAKAPDPPTEQAIIESCGARLHKLFKRFGTPDDVRVANDKDSILVVYGTFSFRVRNKTVQDCFFGGGWKGPVQGIKIGDSREAVVKVLGDKFRTMKNTTYDVQDYGWRMKEEEADLWASFNNENKVYTISIELR